ncbi:MAG: ATP-binding protein [Actinomycetota bacterium]
MSPSERIFPADPVSLRDIRSFVRDEALQATLGTEMAEELTLAVSEAASNSIRHTQTTSIRLEARLEGECLVVEVEDEGTFDSRMPIPELEGPGGRGILLMTAFADEVAILEGTAQDPGTTVRLVKCKPSVAD